VLHGKRDAGLKLFQELALQPAGFAPATTRLAARAYADGNRDEGHRLLNELLAKQPQNPPALQLLGHFYFLENKLDEAFAKGQAASQLDPRLDSGHYLLAQIHLARTQKRLLSSSARRGHATDMPVTFGSRRPILVAR
jgi:predicted Zn-dependent protease